MNKKIVAPLIHDPGKGRPREHLAYLNWQEMQALQRLNGGNMERGPRGLPSFADDSASSMGTERQPDTSYSGNWTGSPNTGTTYGGSTYGGSDTGSNYDASSISGHDSGTTTDTANAAAAGSAVDAAVQAATDVANAVKASQQSAALNEDATRGGIASINVGPMNTPVKIGGGQLQGAMQAVQQQAAAATQPRDMQGAIPARVPSTSYGWVGTGPSKLAGYQEAGIYGRNLALSGDQITQDQFDTLLNANTVTNPTLNAQVNALPEDMRRNAAIAASAYRLAGFDPSVGIQMAAIESNFGTLKNRPGGKYQGMMQFSGPTWSEAADPTSLQLGRNEPWSSAISAANYSIANREKFINSIGAEPTAGDIYGMHQQGPAGYIGLRENPTAPARSLVGTRAVAQNLPKSMRDRSTIRGISAGEFADVISSYPAKKVAALSGVPSDYISASQGIASIEPASISGISSTVETAALNGASPDVQSDVSEAGPTGLAGFGIPMAVMTGIGTLAQNPAQYSFQIPEQPGYIKALPDFVKDAAIRKMASDFGEQLPGMVGGWIESAQKYITPSETEVAPTTTAALTPNLGPANRIAQGQVPPTTIADQQIAMDPQLMGMAEKEMLDAMQDPLDRAKLAQRTFGGAIFGGAGIFGGGQLADAQAEAAKEKMVTYFNAPPEVKRQMELDDPSILGWAEATNVPTSGLGAADEYQKWASASGLTIPEDSRGSDSSSYGNSYSSPYSYAGQQMASRGLPIRRRPKIYQRWDRGQGIPSPGDPLYNQYVEYIQLKEQGLA